MVYFDTSIIVAYYCPEKLSSLVEEIILKENEPAISTLTAVEFASAISRKFREKAVTAENAERMWNQFNYHQIKGYYSILPLNADHYVLAASFILQQKTPLRTLDALHLAVAQEASARIATADRILAKSAEKFNIPHLLIN
jgi:uncharacterized protein